MKLDLPDFDTLKEIAAQDPAALEQIRQEHINALIESAPARVQRRLRGLQFQIDAQRRIHPSPLSACVKISQMMHESFAELRYRLNEFTDLGPRSNLQRALAPVAADVLEFRR